MNPTLHDINTKQLLFIIFLNALDFKTLIAACVLLLSALVITRHKVFKLIVLFIFFVAFLIFTNLAASPVFVQYLLAIPSIGILKVYAIQLAGLIKNIGRPSKSMPGISGSQVRLVEFISKNIFITKYYYKYAKELQKKLLYIAYIYITILLLPDRKLIIHYPRVDEKHKIIEGLAS